MTKHILVTGAPGTGFNHIGPFYDLEAATRYADNSLGNDIWWLLELGTPDDDEHTDVPLKPKSERPNHDDFITVLTTLRYIAIWEKEQDLFESANRALEKVGKAPIGKPRRACCVVGLPQKSRICKAEFSRRLNCSRAALRCRSMTLPASISA